MIHISRHIEDGRWSSSGLSFRGVGCSVGDFSLSYLGENHVSINIDLALGPLKFEGDLTS